jgi:cytoplasmic iron level regulating protein YaaA (DUF328/UPF0246 family)
MPLLLVQSCSATKEPVETPVPALDLYDGYFFRIIKKTLRTNRFQPGIDIIIISAEHGVIEPEDEIGYYDRQMSIERAEALNNDVVTAIARKVDETKYDSIWINLGKDYLPAVDGVEDAVDIPVRYIEGGGIGTKGKLLKHLVSRGRSVQVHGD